MKIKGLIILMLALMLVASIGVCFAEGETTEPTPDASEIQEPSKTDSWQIYLKEKVVPQLILFATNLGGILGVGCTILVPLIKVAKPIMTKCGLVTGEMRVILEENKKNMNKVAELEEINNELVAEQKKLYSVIEEISAKISIMATKDASLVESGKAREICKIDEENGHEETIE